MHLTNIENFVFAHRADGKRETFMFEKDGLRGYLGWAFLNDYLFVVSGESGISGVGVAYPLPKPFDGTVESLLIFEDELECEGDKDLVVMDWVASRPESRRKLVRQFKERFPNWENQQKWGIHYGKPKQLSNNYLNKLEIY